MKILFTGDFHLGSPLFESKDKIMELLNGDYDKIFLVGDIIDVWEDDVVSIVLNNQELLKKINELDNVVIIKGNHDPSIVELETIFFKKEICDSYELEIDGNSMIIMHGDEFDDLVRYHSGLARLLFPIHWIFERAGINLKGFFRTLFHSISAKKENKYYNDLILDMEEHLVDKYKVNYDSIIVGHTHLPKLIEGDGFVYVNCGDWVYNKSYAEYENCKFRLIEL